MLLRRVVMLLACSALVALPFHRRGRPSSCNLLLEKGRWTQDYDPFNKFVQWQPYVRMLLKYDPTTTLECLSNHTLHFIGDSTIRQVFWATAVKLNGDEAYKASTEAGKHEDLVYKHKETRLSFTWDPFLNSSSTTEILTDATRNSNVAGILISAGLWHARYSGAEFVQEYNQTIQRAAQSISGNGSPLVIAVPPPHLTYDWLNPERARTLTRPRLNAILEHLTRVEASTHLEVAWSAREMTTNNSQAITSGGLHVTQDIAAHQSDVLLNRLCNERVFAKSNKASSLPCTGHHRVPKLSFSITFGVFLLGLTIWILHDRRDWSQIECLATMLAVLGYCWLADRTTLLERSHKIVHEKLYVFVTTILVGLGLTRLKSLPRTRRQALPDTKTDFISTQTEFLPRAQTEEWKGWMQVVILLYHYFGMSKVLVVYQVVRLLVASYLFLTAYGHATYFQETNDFSLRRITTVLLRLNMLPALLAIVMNNEYDFYYFPGLASLWFLITYATFWTLPRRNTGNTELVARVLSSACILQLVLSSETLLTGVFRGLRVVHGPKLDPKEFIFRVKLDAYIPYFGMLSSVWQQCGCQKPSLSLSRKLVSLTSVTVREAATVVLAFSMLVAYMTLARQFHDKYAYNHWHCYLSVLPVASYVMLRNLNETCRRHYAPVFAWIGSFSLELFVLQYHIWLAADTKALLRLGFLDTPVFTAGKTVIYSWAFWTESVLITAVFFWVSHGCAQAINELVKWFAGIGQHDEVHGRFPLVNRIGCLLFVLWLFNVLAVVA